MLVKLLAMFLYALTQGNWDCSFVTNTIDEASPWQAMSLTLDNNDFPVINYIEVSEFMLVRCYDKACDSNTLAPIGYAYLLGFNSIALNENEGYSTPVITYIDSHINLKLIQCSDEDCIWTTSTTIVSNKTGSPAPFNSLTLNHKGYARISYTDYYNSNYSALNLIFCHDATCTNTSLSTVDSGENIGFIAPKLALDRNGYAVMAYYYYYNGYYSRKGVLKIARCHNILCTSCTLTTVDHNVTSTNINRLISLALDENDYAVVSYVLEFGSGNNVYLKLARCHDTNCTLPTLNIIDKMVSIGDTSLVLDSDGYPLIIYSNHDGGLKLARCHDTTCMHPTFTTVYSNYQDGYNDLALDSDGYPVMIYSDDFNLLLTRCHSNKSKKETTALAMLLSSLGALCVLSCACGFLYLGRHRTKHKNAPDARLINSSESTPPVPYKSIAIGENKKSIYLANYTSFF